MLGRLHTCSSAGQLAMNDCVKGGANRKKMNEEIELMRGKIRAHVQLWGEILDRLERIDADNVMPSAKQKEVHDPEAETCQKETGRKTMPATMKQGGTFQQTSGWHTMPASDRQVDYLKNLGVAIPADLSRSGASRLIDWAVLQRKRETPPLPRPRGEERHDFTGESRSRNSTDKKSPSFPEVEPWNRTR